MGPQAGQSPACSSLHLGLCPLHFLTTLCLPTHIYPALGCQGPFGEAHVLLATAYTPYTSKTNFACVEVPVFSFNLFPHAILPMGWLY